MEDSQHFNPVFTDAVGNDVWRSGNHQFARSFDAPWAAQGWMTSKNPHSISDRQHYTLGGSRAIARNRFGFRIQVR
jgi:hypothetical protein